VEKEELINAFDAKEYWTMAASLKPLCPAGTSPSQERLEDVFDIKLKSVSQDLVEDEDDSGDDEDEGEKLKL
jgi:DNA topoisomerase IA